MKLYKYYRRAANPTGFWGKRVLKLMNSEQHGLMPRWALDHFRIPPDASILDVGCGSGANIQLLMQRYPQVTVTGIDHSPLAIDFAYCRNYDEIMKRCIVMERSIESLLLSKEMFDLVTAFEAVYYWEDLGECLARIHRVLKRGGTFLIANQLDGDFPEHRDLERKTDNMMHVYSASELSQLLIEAGFANIAVDRDEGNHFVCIWCQKEI